MSTSFNTRNRRASDATSGLELKREQWPDYSEEELSRNFELFKAYDIDNSGFITQENLLEVLRAMGVAEDYTLASVSLIIEEVAVLTGHDNDGKLSFRDYMHAIRYDKQAAEENLALDALDALTVERKLSTIELVDAEAPRPVGNEEAAVMLVGEVPQTPTEPEPEPAPPPPMRARQSSMAALNALASSRIKAFQSLATEHTGREKLAAFRTKPVELGPMVNSDDMHKQTLRNKVAAFEVAATYKGKVELKRTWKKVGGVAQWGSYKAGQTIVLAGQPVGVAPKKKLCELP